METDAARARRYETAPEIIWNLTRGKSGATTQAERAIAAVALGLRAIRLYERKALQVTVRGGWNASV